jgi:hypothetical protein
MEKMRAQSLADLVRMIEKLKKSFTDGVNESITRILLSGELEIPTRNGLVLPPENILSSWR